MLIAPLSVAACAAAFNARSLGAQTDVTIEVGASQIGPPLGAEAESERFGVAGLRASHYSSTAGVFASFLTGRTFGETSPGDFVTGTLGATLGEQWSRRWAGTLDLRVLAFRVRGPFTLRTGVEASSAYSAVAVELEPTIRFDAGPVTLAVSGVAGTGRSRFEVWRIAGGATRALDEPLARIGGTAEVLFGRGPVRFGVTSGTHETPGGSFTSGGARLLAGGRWGAAELRTDVWRTPVGTQTTAGLAVVLPISGWSVRGFFGRSEPDPLTLAEPGSASVGLLVGKRLVSGEDRGPAARPYEIVSPTPTGARVRMTVNAPESAGTVSLLGDFTLWEEVPLRRVDGRWEVELEVPVGNHHYGFLVDGEWYVPDDMRDVVPDEWGRVNAILVIEGVS